MNVLEQHLLTSLEKLPLKVSSVVGVLLVSFIRLLLIKFRDES